MLAAVLAILLTLTGAQTSEKISAAQKAEFIALLAKLPTKGEFYTDASVKKAEPYLPVLFALTEKDIEKYDIYPFVAISRGLCDQPKKRDYAIRHFAEIQHPTLKLGWAVMLFNAGESSPTVVRFLQDALSSEKQSKLLAEMVGPDFEDFKRRVNVKR